MKPKNNGQGKSTKVIPTDKEIEFPVSFNLKAVMEGTTSDMENKSALEGLFFELHIPYTFKDQKLSSKGTYMSFTYQISLQNREEMNQLYQRLQLIKGLKFAL